MVGTSSDRRECELPGQIGRCVIKSWCLVRMVVSRGRTLAIQIKKGTLSQSGRSLLPNSQSGRSLAEGKPPPRTTRSVPTSNARRIRNKYGASSGDSGAPVWLFVTLGILALVIVVVVVSTAGRRPVARTVQRPRKQPVEQTTTKRLKRYDELGGMTLGEHMRKNGGDSEALRAQRKRRSNFMRGVRD